MKYVGIQTQKRRNNFRSLLLLLLFPCLVIGLTYLFCLSGTYLILQQDSLYEDSSIGMHSNEMFLRILPYVAGGIGLWFLFAYLNNTRIIRRATASRPLERKENKRVYNLVENLCMSQGMKMPQINVINDDSLNAFASGINNSTYSVTLSKGIIRKLNDEELEGVIAHELSHIRNRDVRLLIVSIVFVGIFAMLAQICLRMIFHVPRSRNNKNNGGSVLLLILLAVVIASIGYLFSLLMRFAISRKREYLADAGAVEMTKKPYALASALRKIAADPNIEAVTREDVAQLFIEHPGQQAKSMLSGLSGLFATHPPIRKRIEVLEQF